MFVAANRSGQLETGEKEREDVFAPQTEFHQTPGPRKRALSNRDPIEDKISGEVVKTRKFITSTSNTAYQSNCGGDRRAPVASVKKAKGGRQRGKKRSDNNACRIVINVEAKTRDTEKRRGETKSQTTGNKECGQRGAKKKTPTAGCNPQPKNKPWQGLLKY